MAARRWSLRALAETLAVVRLPADAALPAWADLAGGAGGETLCSVTRTADELSIVCASARVPREESAERDWRALVVAGPLDFSEAGVLAALTGVLAGAGVSIFALSTFDTDYLLLREAALETAAEALRAAGHEVSLEPLSARGIKRRR